MALTSANAQDKITYQDHILPLIEANCSKCHNSDKKKAGLDLTSYQGALKGSGSGVVLLSGNPDGSKLWKAVTHAEEPNMPPNRPKLADKDLELIKKWISGGLLENAGGKAVAAAKPALDLTLQSDAIGKPDGPPPMPSKPLPIDPVVHTARMNAITGLASSPWAPLIAVAGQKQVLLFHTDCGVPRCSVGLLPNSSVGTGPFHRGRSWDINALVSVGIALGTGREPLLERMSLLDGQLRGWVELLRCARSSGQHEINSTLRVVSVSTKKEVSGTTDTLALLGILPFTEGQPVDLKFSRNGKLLLAGGGRGANSGGIMVWDIVAGQRLMTIGKEYDTVLAADLRPDQSQIALGGPGRLVKIFSTKTSELQHKIKKHTEWVTAIAFSPNGQMLASADRNGGISVWDPDNAQELFTLGGHKSAVTFLSWRGDSKLLASSSEDGTVKTWEMKEGKQVKRWNAHAGGVESVSYAYDGRLVSCGRDNAVAIWNASGGKERNLDGAGDLPLRAAFSYDSKRIFASDFTGHIGVWVVADGKRVGELNANPPASSSIVAARN